MVGSRSRLPSLSELIAFESAARLKSFTLAASELNLTQGAISRQIRSLEQTIRVKLFERVRRSIILTDAGTLYLGDVRKIVNALSEATERITGFGSDQVLNLAVLPTFASRWLIPRLSLFSAIQPNVTINLMVRLEPFSFEDQPFDAAIHFGDEVWPRAKTLFLCREENVAVASPALVKSMGLKSSKDLARVTLLHQTTRPHAWLDWFYAQNLTVENAFLGPRIEQFGMIIEAAKAGLGVALVPHFLASGEIASKELTVIGGIPSKSDKAYWLAIPEHKTSSPLVTSFASWLQQEVSNQNVRQSGKTASSRSK